MRIPLRLNALVVILLLAPAVSSQEDIWIEGESARESTMRAHPWYGSVRQGALSGGEWLSHFQNGEPPEASFTFRVKKAGERSLWLRCNPSAGARISYRLGKKGEWLEVPVASAVERLNIASDGKPDMRFVAWVNVGKVKLGSGNRSISFRFESDNNCHGAIDCFLFTARSFQPRGALKPGEKSGLVEKGYFAWEPAIDDFGDEALVDLRELNEERAGLNGRVRRDGEHFELGDGSRVRFWAANAGPGVWALDHESHVYLARRLAKSGVNMVRLHGGIYDQRDPAVDLKRLDDLHHLVHALKEEGIYSSLSFYFPHWFRLDGDRIPFMLLFFDEEMQTHYRSWAKALLTTENPYTGQSLAEDPAVALVEILNEDSHFFWTFGPKSAPAQRWEKLKTAYGAWLQKRHGSVQKAIRAWGGVTMPGDSPAEGKADLYGAWEMTGEGIASAPKRRARVSDQVRFLAENMRGFYERTIREFREDLGYEGLVSCGNWHVSDARILDALERHGYAAGDVMDHHGYFDHGHEGDASNYAVRQGQTFTSQSALSLTQANPLPFVSIEGFPHIVSEIGWPAPNAYRSEFSFLTSAYGLLQGLDGIFNFAIGGAGWDRELAKFPMNTPVTLGCFPAAATLYRRGYLEEAKPVVREVVDVESLYRLEGTKTYVRPALDAFRAKDLPRGRVRKGEIAELDPLTFYVGRVVRRFGGKAGGSYQRSLDGLVDREKKVVTSSTGELRLDWGRGLLVMDAKRAQGAAGFLGRHGVVETADARITMANDYGTVTIVSLDGEPIRTSKRILIQTMTVERPYGFRASGDEGRSGRIEALGSAPFQVERFDVQVDLKLVGKGRPKVVACDEHGYPKKVRVRMPKHAGRYRVELDSESPYHLILR